MRKVGFLIVEVFLIILLVSLVSATTTISDLGIITSGYNTGDVLNGEIGLSIGTDFGAMRIGRIQLFQSNIVVGNLDVNGTFITRHRGGSSNVRFAWMGTDDFVNLAIPKEGRDFALYNPRSEMIGGDSGQIFNNGMVNCSAQGYDKLDCDTNLTGADLGVQDDVQLHGTLFVGESIIVSGLEGSYSNGEAYVCVYDNGTIFSKDSPCI